MNLSELSAAMLPAIEHELRTQIARIDSPQTSALHAMLTYHMGWTGEMPGPEASGKRVRPLIVMLCSAACGVDWHPSLPAAAAIELIHNFSLVHDDIEDNSDKRRGRATLWTKWGEPQAINAGDALFVIANRALFDLSAAHPAGTVVRAAAILQDTCLELTRGQFLDMSYESRSGLTIDDYWPMISGKTSALVAASAQIGALLGGANDVTIVHYKQFGHHLGLAFQVQDDVLGIWGDESITGKSAASDLVEGKNSLPVLYGLGKKSKFARRWAQGPLRVDEVRDLAAELEREGARSYAEQVAREQTDKALMNLEEASAGGEAGAALLELANKLLGRAV